MEQARGRLRHGTATVAVVGEFKQGKSTLVNALLQTAVCPVDADIVTAVPTVVGHGEKVSVTAYLEPVGDGPVRPVQASLNDIRELVATSSGDGGQRYVEVHLPHRMLRAGLRLIDTPGVGGLDSAYGQLALGALQTADGALFVTDASQELTAPELDFLRSATSRCPNTAVVISKTDLYPEWRRMVELNQSHLRAAGIEVPVLPVSSFLRLRATTDPSLNEEAGFAPLVTFLASVVSTQAGRAAEQAAAEVDFVAEHLAAATQAERAVLAEPVRSADVIEDLDRTRQRAAGLAAASAGWKVALADGVQDLIADVDHDLQQRLRSVLREVEGIIDAGDPAETWSDIEVWLRRQVATAVLQNRELLQSRATDLATDLAVDFELTGGAFALRLRGLSDVSETAAMPDAAAIALRPGRLQSIMMVTRTTTFGPMLIMGVAGLFGLAMPLVGVAAAAVGAGLGRRALREETERVRSGRRLQAKAAARKYVEEVSFVLGKESRDSLRETQRQLRDDFQARAEVLEASVAAAHRAAQQASALTPEARAARSRELDAHTDRLAQLTSRPRGTG
nr:dynamin family protein [Ornithinimicrobium sp. F0845]